MAGEDSTPTEIKNSNSKNPNNSNSNPDMDSSNPYYVHHLDHPGHTLVPTKLNGANYPSWSKSMVHALTAKNKIGFVNGSIQPPSETEHPTQYALWNQCNSMILSWLAHSVEPNLAQWVVHAKTAQQVWDDFKDQFSQKNAPTIYQIQKSIASLSQGTMTIAAYFTKLKGLWDELETDKTPLTCNEMKAHNEQREEDKMMQFLMGLNDTFSGVRSNILMITPLPKVRQAYSLDIQEETQRQMTSGTTENFYIAAAIQSRPNSSRNKHCDHCDRNGHAIADCRQLKFHCNFCNRNGHTEETCRFKDRTYTSSGQGNYARNENQGSNRGANSCQNSGFSGSNTRTFTQQSRGFVPHAGSSFPSAHAAQQANSSSVTQPSQNPIQAPDFLEWTYY